MRRIGLVILSVIGAGCDGADDVEPFTAGTVRAEWQAQIGETAGPSEYLFGRIVGVAVTGQGITYVADAIGSSVRAYDDSGRYLKTIGSEGDGPGEFQRLLGLDVNGAEQLIVRGAFRLSVFGTPENGLIADSLIRTTAIAGLNPDRDVRGRLVGSHYYGPSYFWEGFQRRGYFYLLYDSLGVISDTVFVPPFPNPETTGLANYPISDQGGRNVQGINRAPFEASPSWDVTGAGHVLFAVGDRYEIVEVDRRGDTVQTIRQAVPVQPVPDEERSDSARAFKARLDSLPVPLGQVRGMSEIARSGDVPAHLPHILAVHAGEGGETWVRRWPRAGIEETMFDVFGATGVPLRQVVVPAALSTAPAPWLSPGLIAGVTTDPATGVERVAVFRLAVP